MKILKSTIGVTFALGVCSLVPAASADVFSPNFPVSELHATGAGNTAGSFAASAMMGGQGHSNQAIPLGWESSIRTSCASLSGATPWPGGCNPSGMAQAVHNLTTRSWVQFTWADTDQVSALNEIVASLQTWHSPGIIPIYGQADHWVAITQVTATLSGSNWAIGNVKFFDGGPVGGTDGGTNSYESGLLSFSGSVFKNVYFKVIANINPACDPCTTDPWYNKYVLMWEPPVEQMHTKLVASFPRAPGVIQGAMTEPLAQSLVFRALSTGGVSADPQIWNAISGGVAGTAFEVNGVAPNGERWDYFLVPILSSSTAQVIAYAQLAADDGAYESVQVLSTPTTFNPVNRGRAETLARGALNKGESLTPGILTWDPRATTPFAKSPTFPYYEFGILSGNKEVGVVRVSLNKGSVARAL